MYHGQNRKKHGEAPEKDYLYLGDTGGACRLDGIFHPAIYISKRKYGEKRNTKTNLADCEMHQKNKYGKKKIQLLVRYILKRKDGMKRNPQNHLAGEGVRLKMQSALQDRKT